MFKIQLHAYILAAILGLTLVMVESSSPVSVEGRVRTEFKVIPMQLNGWVGTDGRFDELTYELLPSCSLLLRFYEHQVYPTVDLAIVYGTDLGDFHQPEVCLEGQGLRSVEKKNVMMDAKDGPFEAVSVITESSEGRRAFVFWFAGNGRTSTLLGDYKMKLFIHRLLNQQVQPSAMIRLSTPAVETDAEAIERLKVFGQELFPYLQKEFSIGKGAEG